MLCIWDEKCCSGKQECKRDCGGNELTVLSKVLMELSKGKTGATSIGGGIFEIGVAVSGRHSKNTTHLLESIWINQRKIKEVEKHV